MRTGTTILLLLVAAGAFAFVYLKERTLLTTTETESRPPYVILANPRDIVAVSVKNSLVNLEFVRAVDQNADLSEENSDSESHPLGLTPVEELAESETKGVAKTRWKVTGTVEDRADTDWVAGLIEAACSLHILEEISSEEVESSDFDLKEFGLDESATVLSLTDRKGDRYTVQVGTSGAMNDTVHLRSVENGTSLAGRAASKAQPVYLVASIVRDLLQFEPDQVRDRLLWGGSPDLTRHIVYRGKQGELTFERETLDDFWKIVRPLQTDADDDAIEGLLALIGSVEAEAFIGPDKIQPAEPDPSDVVTLVLGETATDENAVTLSFWEVLNDTDSTPATATPTVAVVADVAGASPSVKVVSVEEADAEPVESEDYVLPDRPRYSNDRKVYARVSNRPIPMEVDSRLMTALRYNTNDLRNRRLARLNEEGIGAVLIETPSGLPVDLVRSQQGWVLRRQERFELASPARLKRLFTAINEQEILDFASDSASSLTEFGLDNPALVVSFLSGPGGPGERLLLGGDRGRVFAHWEGDPFVYRVDSEILNEIPSQAVKWKDSGVMRFSIFSLRALRISPGMAAPTDLRYDFQTGAWSLKRGGTDVSDLVDPSQAEALVAQLGSLQAVDWLAEGGVGFAALKEPELVIDVTLQKPDAGGGPNGEIINLRLSFAKTGEQASGGSAELYYGTVDSVPEVFLIEKSVVDQLASPPVRK